MIIRSSAADQEASGLAAADRRWQSGIDAASMACVTEIRLRDGVVSPSVTAYARRGYAVAAD